MNHWSFALLKFAGWVALVVGVIAAIVVWSQTAMIHDFYTSRLNPVGAMLSVLIAVAGFAVFAFFQFCAAALESILDSLDSDEETPAP